MYAVYVRYVSMYVGYVSMSCMLCVFFVCACVCMYVCYDMLCINGMSCMLCRLGVLCTHVCVICRLCMYVDCVCMICCM